MKLREILKHVDHTLLTPTAVWEDIQKVCDEAIRWGAASVCIPPSYVKAAAEYVAGGIPICTVIGFPNGYARRRRRYGAGRNQRGKGRLRRKAP